MVVVAMVVMVSHLVATRWRGFHHSQHLTAAGAQEPPAEDAGERKYRDHQEPTGELGGQELPSKMRRTSPSSKQFLDLGAPPFRHGSPRRRRAPCGRRP